MLEEKEKLLRLVNSSGFPFQLRVADEIVKRVDPFFRWKLVAQEYPWAAEDGQEGFIDLVIRNELADRMVLECKRTRDADWIFLLPDDGSYSRLTAHARMLYVKAPNGLDPDQLRIDWHDFYSNPESEVSEFCIVRGSGEGQQPMLENLSRRLLNSVECFAREEAAFAIERKVELNSLYVPVVVTNANVQVCRFKLGSTSLDEGTLLDGEFETVPFIRFSKTLSTKRISLASDLGSANRERQRTVFVVQSCGLIQFLEAWHMTNSRQNQRPWM